MPFSSLPEGQKADVRAASSTLLHHKMDKLVLKRQYKPGWIFQDTCKLWSHFEARFGSSDETPPSENLGTMVTACLRGPSWWLTHEFMPRMLLKPQLCISLTSGGDWVGIRQTALPSSPNVCLEYLAV